MDELNRSSSAQGVRNEFGLPVRFVAAADEPGTPGPALRPDGPAYESQIAETGRVPTRTTGAGAWHDYFNALAWLRFPKSKAQLNRRQAQAIGETGVAGHRGPLRDALTLFDESAAVLVCTDDSLVRSLRRFEWNELFVSRRDAFDRCVRSTVFGHALLQKLANPYKSICAHALVIPADELDGLANLDALDDPCPVVDQRLACHLADCSFGKSMLTPLPVLGIPGWWSPNEAAEFYNDAQVFRSRRRSGRDQELKNQL